MNRDRSKLNCEMKVVREWLRVTCRRNGDDLPDNVEAVRTDGQQAFFSVLPDEATDAVVQLVRGKEHVARYYWNTKGRAWETELSVSWNGERPSILMRGPDPTAPR